MARSGRAARRARPQACPGRADPAGGLAVCRCGNPVIAGTNATGKQIYRCNPQTRGDRPGPHCQQMTGNVDGHVEKVIVRRLSRATLPI